MFMELKKKLSIVIPCKNESETISKTLDLLNYQKGIENVDVIVADSSTDNTVQLLLKRKNDKFKLLIVRGGYPSVARNNGATLVVTPLVLFLDSDIFLLNSDTLSETVNLLINKNMDLVTIKFESDNRKHNSKFKSFSFFQKYLSEFSPFALGGFMLLSLDKFKEIGKFNEEVLVGEDYLLSRKIEPDRFEIANITAFTTPRRYEKKSVWYMLKLVIKSYINRNNLDYFKKDHNYWV